MGVHCCYLHVNYIVYKVLDRLLHVGSLDPIYEQNFRPVLLRFLRYWDSNLRTRTLAVGVCCFLQTCNSVGNILVMGFILGPSLMVISITGILLYILLIPYLLGHYHTFQRVFAENTRSRRGMVNFYHDIRLSCCFALTIPWYKQNSLPCIMGVHARKLQL